MLLSHHEGKVHVMLALLSILFDETSMIPIMHYHCAVLYSVYDMINCHVLYINWRCYILSKQTLMEH